MFGRIILAAAVLIICCVCETPAKQPDQAAAQAALKKVVGFYRTEVAYEGAYLYRYSSDLKQQEGEGRANATSGWTQPPGTPWVGEAYLDAWRMSGDRACLDAAIEAATALVRSQLKSGGWSSHFDLGPEGQKSYAYRIHGEKSGKRNDSTFDDNKSQSALMLLMHVDEELEFSNAAIHEAVEYALSHFLAAQYANGAWPQQFREPANADEHSPRRASYPNSWSRIYEKIDYRRFYTFNDNNMSHIIDMLFEASRIYGRDDCAAAARKTGDFFLLAQMPDPQPGWAQQYDRDMHPVWARKFEPPAVTGGESQSVMQTLIRLYRHTGDMKYIEGLPKALEYYKRSLLPDGRLARFYELNTNRPLFFTKEYELTFSDADMPTHYSFKVSSRLDSIERELARVKELSAGELPIGREVVTPQRLTARVAERGRRVLEQLDTRGAWVESGSMRTVEGVSQTIEMKTFGDNLRALAAFAGAVP